MSAERKSSAGAPPPARRDADPARVRAHYYLPALLGRAFEVIAGEAYNQYRYEALERARGRLLFYEVSLLEEKPWPHLRDQVFPNLIRYLSAKRISPESGRGLVVAVFHGSECHLIRGEDFFSLYREIEGVDFPGFRRQVARWLAAE